MEPEILTQITAINSALTRTTVLYNEWARKHSVNRFTVIVLYVLHMEGPVTQKKISDENKIPKQTVNNIITSLKESGHVTLANCEDDKREKPVMLTEKGRDCSTKLLDSLFQLEERTVKKMGTRDILKLIELITMYGDIMESEM